MVLELRGLAVSREWEPADANVVDANRQRDAEETGGEGECESLHGSERWARVEMSSGRLSHCERRDHGEEEGQEHQWAHEPRERRVLLRQEERAEGKGHRRDLGATFEKELCSAVQPLHRARVAVGRPELEPEIAQHHKKGHQHEGTALTSSPRDQHKEGRPQDNTREKHASLGTEPLDPLMLDAVASHGCRRSERRRSCRQSQSEEQVSAVHFQIADKHTAQQVVSSGSKRR